jgi:hypothetical protein
MQGCPQNFGTKALRYCLVVGSKLPLSQDLNPCLKALSYYTFVVRKWTCITQKNQAQHGENFIVFFFLSFCKATLARSFFF